MYMVLYIGDPNVICYMQRHPTSPTLLSAPCWSEPLFATFLELSSTLLSRQSILYCPSFPELWQLLYQSWKPCSKTRGTYVANIKLNPNYYELVVLTSIVDITFSDVCRGVCDDASQCCCHLFRRFPCYIILPLYQVLTMFYMHYIFRMLIE